MNTPVYSTDAARVEQLLSRLRSMSASVSGDDPHNTGIRAGIRTAALAVKEELDTQLVNTLAGPPPEPPSLRERLASVDEGEIQLLVHVCDSFAVDLATVVMAAGCGHEFAAEAYDCEYCGVPGSLLEQLDWPRDGHHSQEKE